MELQHMSVITIILLLLLLMIILLENHKKKIKNSKCSGSKIHQKIKYKCQLKWAS